MSEDRQEFIQVHRQLATHEERLRHLVTKDEMGAAIAVSLDRQTMALEKLEVEMKKRADEQLAIQRIAHGDRGASGDTTIRWVSIGLTAFIVLLGLLQGSGGGMDTASFALDVGSFNQ